MASWNHSQQTGIRQGDGLSPLLFCLFVDDLNMIFDQACAPCKIGDLYINHLLYADDLVLISENVMGLRRCLDNLNIFCKRWKLQVDLSKTKVIILRRRCKHEISRFEIGNNVLEVVHSYKYLDSLCLQMGHLHMV